MVHSTMRLVALCALMAVARARLAALLRASTMHIPSPCSLSRLGGRGRSRLHVGHDLLHDLHDVLWPMWVHVIRQAQGPWQVDGLGVHQAFNT